MCQFNYMLLVGSEKRSVGIPLTGCRFKWVTRHTVSASSSGGSIGQQPALPRYMKRVMLLTLNMNMDEFVSDWMQCI